MSNDGRVGFDGILKYKVGGVEGGGDWVEIENIGDVTINDEESEAEVKNRMSRHVRVLPGMVQLSIEFDMDVLPTYPGYVALRNAKTATARADKIIGIRAYDGGDPDNAGDDGQGVEFDAVVTRFHRNQPLEGPQTVSVTLKPSALGSAPRYII